MLVLLMLFHDISSFRQEEGRVYHAVGTRAMLQGILLLFDDN